MRAPEMSQSQPGKRLLPQATDDDRGSRWRIEYTLDLHIDDDLQKRPLFQALFLLLLRAAESVVKPLITTL